MNKSKIDELIDKTEITDVVNSYFRALDEKHFDAQHVAALFTAEAKATRPNGSSMAGPEEISASHARSLERFESSQHLVAGHDISVSGNRATARANLVAMHMWQGSHTTRTTWTTSLLPAVSYTLPWSEQMESGRSRR